MPQIHTSNGINCFGVEHIWPLSVIKTTGGIYGKGGNSFLLSFG